MILYLFYYIINLLFRSNPILGFINLTQLDSWFEPYPLYPLPLEGEGDNKKED